MKTAILGDYEIAATLDSLALTRDHLREKGTATPNIDQALKTFRSLVQPSTYAIYLVPRDHGEPDPIGLVDDLRVAVGGTPEDDIEALIWRAGQLRQYVEASEAVRGAHEPRDEEELQGG